MAKTTFLHVFLSVSCLIVILVGVQSQPNPKVCIPHSSEEKGQPLPLLPDQLMLRAEANILGWNRTVEVVEYYDSINNRGAVHSIYNGNIIQTVINYQTREIITVTPGAGCSVKNLTFGGFNIFGFKLQNGTAHIGSIADIFKFGANYNEIYVGKTYVRGIPADHWQSCLFNNQTNGTSLLNYYFSIPGYKNAYGDSQIPLRLVLNGTAPSHRIVNRTHSFSHVYEFFDVQFHPEFPDRSFEPPLGVVCPGRKSFKPLPKVPDQFSTSLEVVIPGMKQVFYMSEVYNYKSKMVATYFSYKMNGSIVPTSYRSLDDFNTGLTYRINRNTGFCNVTPIALFSPDAESPDHVHVQIKNIVSFIHLDTQDWQYQGISNIRGMEAESWIVARSDWKPFWLPDHPSEVNSTWEFFFTTDSWNTQGGLNKSTNMPIMSKVDWIMQTDKGNLFNGSYIYNYFHFDSANVDPSHFDLSPCFSSENSKEFAFDILEMGIYNTVIANNTIAFYYGVVHSLATAAGISPARIANVFAAEDIEKVTTVFFNLLGVPAVEGDAVDMIKQPSLTDAAVALEMLINLYDEKVPFRVTFNYKGMKKSLTAKPDTLRNSFKQNQPDSGTKTKQFSTGAFVGFGVAMLIIGAVLGIGILVFVYKRKNLKIPYDLGIH